MIDLIRVSRKGNEVHVYVGDVEIPPSAIRRNSVFTGVDPDEPPTLDLTLMAHQVEINNESEA